MFKKIIPVAICLIVTTCFGSTVFASARKPNDIYKIEIAEPPKVQDDLERLQDMLGENMNYQGYLILDKKSTNYILVYSESLAQKAAKDSKILKGLSKLETRGVNHGIYEYKNGRLSLSDADDEYEYLYNTHIGNTYETENEAETLKLKTNVTKMGREDLH